MRARIFFGMSKNAKELWNAAMEAGYAVVVEKRAGQLTTLTIWADTAKSFELATKPYLMNKDFLERGR